MQKYLCILEEHCHRKGYTVVFGQYIILRCTECMDSNRDQLFLNMHDFVTGLFDGRPADYLFMILFNGIILIVSFYQWLFQFLLLSQCGITVSYILHRYQCYFNGTRIKKTIYYGCYVNCLVTHYFSQ